MIQVFNEDLNLDIDFSWPNKSDINQPGGHRTEGGKLIPCPPDDDYNLDWIEPAGDVNISLPNYCQFIQLHLKGLAGEDNYLKAESYQLMHTDSRNAIYAYGWGNFAQGGHQYSAHAGSAGTFLTNVLIDHTESMAYIIMMNTDSPAAREVMQKLTQKMEEIALGPK